MLCFVSRFIAPRVLLVNGVCRPSVSCQPKKDEGVMGRGEGWWLSALSVRARVVVLGSARIFNNPRVNRAASRSPQVSAVRRSDGSSKKIAWLSGCFNVWLARHSLSCLEHESRLDQSCGRSRHGLKNKTKNKRVCGCFGGGRGIGPNNVCRLELEMVM